MSWNNRFTTKVFFVGWGPGTGGVGAVKKQLCFSSNLWSSKGQPAVVVLEWVKSVLINTEPHRLFGAHREYTKACNMKGFTVLGCFFLDC